MLADVLEKTRSNDAAPLPLPKVRSLVTEAMEDGVHSARRAMKYGRYAAEDAIGDALHTMRRKPLQVMGAALAVGVLIGGFLSWIEFRRQ